MKARLEKIEPGFGNSFTIRRFTAEGENKASWHFHPEYEIVYISNGRGKRHIANHISYFEDGDLIFLGPDLPHFGFTEELFEDHEQIVVQMKADFLGAEFLQQPELQFIRQLFQRAQQGISFGAEVQRRAGARLGAMLQMNSFERLLELLRILQELATTQDYRLLDIDHFALEVNAEHFERMQIVYEYVGKHYQEALRLEQIAARVNMTVPAFCRFFKKLTSKTFTQFVNELRITQACQLLTDEHRSIAEISFESGFNNLSHFNKQFRLVTGSSPRDFRKNLRKVLKQNKRTSNTSPTLHQ